MTGWLENSLMDFNLKMEYLYPDLQISYELMNSYLDILQRLNDDNSIFALFWCPEAYNITTNNRIVFKELISADIVALMSSEHPMAKYNSLTFKNLKKYSVCSRFPDAVDYDVFPLQQIIKMEENPVLFEKYILSGKYYTLGCSLPFSPYYFPYIDNVIVKTVTDAPQSMLFLAYNKHLKIDQTLNTFFEEYKRALGVN